MHILQFSISGTPIPAINGGAAQQIVESLSKEFVKKGHRVTVISTANIKDKDRLKKIARDGVEYKYIYYKSTKKMNYIKLLPYIPQIIKSIIRNGPYDIIHIHNPTWIILFTLLRFLIGRPKIFWQVHNKPRNSIVVKLAKLQDIYIVGVSNAILKSINVNINKEKNSVIPNVIQSHKFKILNKRERDVVKKYYKVSDEKFIIGYAGRISPEKGLHILFESLENLSNNEREKITVVIAGSSWFKNAEITEYERELYERSKMFDVIWLGYIDNWDLYRFYNVCDVIVVPSVGEEAAGLVILESQLCGTNVIASHIGGIPEYISPYDFTFESGNSKDLFKKLTYTINKNDQNSCETKEARRTWVKRNFNVNTITNMWLTHYNK